MAKILIACSGYKDVLQAPQVCEALKLSLLSINSSLQIHTLPLSDGGEGFLRSLYQSSPSTIQLSSLSITGPLGSPVICEYGQLLSSPPIGIIELARCSGIEFVPQTLRNPYHTTSHGTGQVIQHLYDKGIKDFYLGLGGSSTTDGGLSVLYPLEGFKFEFDCEKPAYITGDVLTNIRKVKINEESNMTRDLNITLACDVNNPLLGPSGSARVFGPQKGISPEMMDGYENIMLHVADLLQGIRGNDVRQVPFTGAAGGISGGFLAAFENCKVERGIDMIAKAVGLEGKIGECDVVITGEGCYDSQTKGGKVVSKIREMRSNAVIVCGINKTEEREGVYDLVSRFGEKSVSHAEECLRDVAVEIYEKEILKLL